MQRGKPTKNKKYSPAIRSELIERLDRERKRRRVPMMKLLNWIVEKALPEWEARHGQRCTAWVRTVREYGNGMEGGNRRDNFPL